MYLFKLFTILECIFSNRCYAVTDGYTFKSVATERVVSNRCYTVGNSYACEAAARFKRAVSNRCYAVRDSYACKAATAERVVSNRCYAVRDSDAFKVDATRERIVSNRCYAVRNFCIFTTDNKRICFRFYNCIAIFSAIVFCIATFCFNTFKSVATAERVFSNRCYAVGYSYACKVCTIIVFATSYYSIFCE